MKRWGDFLYLFFCVSIVSCAGPSRFDIKKYYSGPILTYDEILLQQTPTAKDYPHASALYLLRQGKYSIDRISTFSEHITIKILREGGKRYADVRIPFWEDCEVLDLRARTIKPNGDIIDLDNTQFYEVTDFPEFILYADRKAKVFTFPSVDSGCVLDYIYTIGYPGPYVPIWYFQADEPTYYARFTYDVPSSFGFDYVLSALPGHDIQKTVYDTGNRNIATFVAKNLPALKTEPLSPPKNDVASWIMMSWSSIYHFLFGEVKSGQESWPEIGNNYAHFVENLLKPDETIEKKAREITRGVLTDEDKIACIYRFIQENFRYVAIAVEGHRVLPHPPAVVLQNQYGDCKDLTAILCSLLKAIDVDAVPVLVKTRKEGKFIKEFPTVNQIDHVVTAIPLRHFDAPERLTHAVVYGDNDFSRSDDYVIVDPTASTYPIGKLHSGIQGRNAVLCLSDSSRLITIPAGDMHENTWTTSVIFDYSESGCDGIVSSQITGEGAAYWRHVFAQSSYFQNKGFIQTAFNEYSLPVTVDTFYVEHLKELDSIFTLIVHIKAPDPLQVNKGYTYVPVLFLPHGQFKEMLSYQDRHHNIELEYPYLRRTTFKLTVPNDYTFISLPQLENVKNSWCEYVTASYMHGDTAVVTQTVAIKDCFVPKEKFEEIRYFARRILDARNSFIVISRKK